LSDLNYGTDVLASEHFLAGDGPITAGVLTALGRQTTLTATTSRVGSASAAQPGASNVPHSGERLSARTDIDRSIRRPPASPEGDGEAS
jgi:hypothetical protein